MRPKEKKPRNRSINRSSAIPAQDARVDPGKGFEKLLHLHIADYQAITNRSTVWITIQHAFWPLLGTFYLLAAAVQGSLDEDVFAWSIPLGTLALVQTYYFALHEVYSNAKYVERVLKYMVVAGIPVRSDEFWRFETYLKDRRGKRPMWGEWFPLTLGIVSIVTTVLRTISWSGFDYVGLAISVLAGGIIVREVARVVRTRKDLTGPELKLTDRTASE